MKTNSFETPTIVSPEQWLAARREFLREEKEFSKLRDRVAAHRRELPWVKVTTPYVFESPQARDISFVAISSAPLAEIERFKARMGWKFDWVSSHGTSFNRDFRVSFTPEEVEAGKAEYNFGMNEIMM